LLPGKIEHIMCSGADCAPASPDCLREALWKRALIRSTVSSSKAASRPRGSLQCDGVQPTTCKQFLAAGPPSSAMKRHADFPLIPQTWLFIQHSQIACMPSGMRPDFVVYGTSVGENVPLSTSQGGHAQAHLNVVFLLVRADEIDAGVDLAAVARVGALLRSAERKRIAIAG
jgi:hypothetical protein